MVPAYREELTGEELDTIAWEFFRSEFAGRVHANWPIDRRIEAFLSHHGPAGLIDDGSAYSALLERIMANIGQARRSGVLPSSNN